ncbi:MAG: hypothetical protein KAW14_10290 [Candidatus Aegiribacteria sp.]|nr:hypothetical protein [Candidatus Aegiribacteria sp.]
MTPPSVRVPRFCRKPDKTVRFDSDGFLTDPESQMFKWLNLEAKSLVKYDMARAIILLGEPDIGKSIALEDMRDRAIQVYNEEQICWIDFQQIGSKRELYTKVLTNISDPNPNEELDHVYLFLDGLDECSEREELTATWISDLLSNPRLRNRIFPRISCRTIAWPTSLQSHLRKHFPELEVLELLPFRKIDVERIARTTIPEDELGNFLKALSDFNLGALAARPITLDMLLNLWGNGDLQGELNRIELYEQGLTLYCEEHSDIRRERRHLPERSPDELLIIAARIAAITLFCKKPLIQPQTQVSPLQKHIATSVELGGGRESTEKGIFSIREQDLLDTLDSDLFSSRGNGLIGWAHRSFQEFLAAMYLAHHNVSAKKAHKMLEVFWNRKGHIAPQQYGLAGWFAARSCKFKNRMMKSDPLVLITGAPSQLSYAERKKLLASLLCKIEKEELFDIDRVAMKFLMYEGIEKILSPIISSYRNENVLRRTVINIAIECNLKTICPLLIKVALDQDDIAHIRAKCVLAVAQLGSDAQIEKLLPLLGPDREPDPDDEIKGNVLLSLWPDQLSADILFSSLTAVKNQRLFGAYIMAIKHKIPETLTPEHLIVALQWIEDKQNLLNDDDSFNKLENKIFELAFQNLRLPDVIEILGRIISLRIKNRATPTLPYSFDNSALTVLTNDAVLRRVLVSIIVSELKENPNALIQLFYGANPFVLIDDLDWLLESFQSIDDVQTKTAWWKLILWVADLRIADIRSKVEGILYKSELEQESREWFSAFDKEQSEARKSDNEYENITTDKKDPNIISVAKLLRQRDRLDSVSIWPAVFNTLLN